MEPANPGLAFETPIYEIEARLEKLKQVNRRDADDEIRRLRRQMADVTREIYSNLTPWQIVQVARHKNRPQTTDYISLLFDDFVELHGDRLFGDDAALVSGLAKLNEFKVMVIGHRKGRTTRERTECFFGCAHPEGYRKAMSKMKMAAKFGIPVVCLIDTPGAYPGVGAEERGQAQAIAENMFEMSRLKTPIVCLVIGEGGSGGALGIGVGDRVAMLQFAYYSVISPEGCAGILWKSHEYAERAAEALKFTSGNLLEFGVIDDVIEEPLGGAHRDHHQVANRMKIYLTRQLRNLASLDTESLLNQRYEKFRRMGVFLDEVQSPQPGSEA